MVYRSVNGLDQGLITSSSEHSSPQLGPDDVSHDDRRLMSAFCIGHDGRYYRYSGYRYDHLADAVAYAELMHSRQSMEVGRDPFTPGVTTPPPSPSDREIMATWRISFKAGTYTYREYKYDHLVDAVNYARMRDAERR